ncbi:xyloglucan endotransglucosylase/hydrolase protein 2-like isoform X2 [Andrographis paniculata]|uniref:xyloglucan endotransglucosylase/hydrolase protein 2-like isoform X2 n=1 Tax=Andrographis paniculata TaxID=175694 RepID=UPI0021E891B3|nr:xyloglucan endotransglucosylase/hydrolase protein 2-like isoform X2 [Andrographis paniculata]
MNYCRVVYLFEFILIFSIGNATTEDVLFDQNYGISWGSRLVRVLDQGSGFQSKARYGSGFFQLRMKMPDNDCAGVVVAFYLMSKGRKHDEIDFELLGNLKGRPMLLQTNLFANDTGKREQRIRLWFDPTAAFHSYRILWNRYNIVFYVDDVPIRVFKNKRRLGVLYPARPMRVEASIWNGEKWATDGGRTKTNWSKAPFDAAFQHFAVDGCPLAGTAVERCYASRYWWNAERYWTLSEDDHRKLQLVRDKYLTYDYCTDTKRFRKPAPECPFNQ